MDPDSKRYTKEINDLEIQILKQRVYAVPDAGNVFQSAWIRRVVQADNGLDRFLLDYGFNFLWRCGLFSWFIFFTEKIF